MHSTKGKFSDGWVAIYYLDVGDDTEECLRRVFYGYGATKEEAENNTLDEVEREI